MFYILDYFDSEPIEDIANWFIENHPNLKWKLDDRDDYFILKVIGSFDDLVKYKIEYLHKNDIPIAIEILRNKVKPYTITINNNQRS